MDTRSGWLLRSWYSPRPIWFLIPLSWLFWLLSVLRRAAYRMGVLRTARLPLPVVVAGNLSVGGTGKTPFVVWLALALAERGHKPGIVSRGYGGETRAPMLVTADSDPVGVGDEAVLLARRSGMPVAICRDRAAAARFLAGRYALDVILSDDGLQHYRLPRDLEIALLDGERGLGNGWLLPAGPLRETERRLGDTAFVVVKRSGAAHFTWPGAIYMPLKADTAVSLSDGRRVPLKDFAGHKVHAVAAIGNPGQFFAGLRAAGLLVEGHGFPDHARYLPQDLQFPGADPVFMTEKDAVKCGGMTLSRHWYVEASAEVSAPDRALILTRVEAVIAAHRQSS
jgi:tetraacyldisaccharide 4'-kinase